MLAFTSGMLSVFESGRYHGSIEARRLALRPFQGGFQASKLLGPKPNSPAAERNTPSKPKDVHVGHHHLDRMVEERIEAYEGVEHYSCIGAAGPLLRRIGNSNALFCS